MGLVFTTTWLKSGKRCRGEHRGVHLTMSLRACRGARRGMMSWKRYIFVVEYKNRGMMSWRTRKKHVVEPVVEWCRGVHNRWMMSWRTRKKHVVEPVVEWCRGEHENHVVEHIVEIVLEPVVGTSNNWLTLSPRHASTTSFHDIIPRHLTLSPRHHSTTPNHVPTTCFHDTQARAHDMLPRHLTLSPRHASTTYNSDRYRYFSI